MFNIPAEILARLMDLVGREVNQKEFVSKMMNCRALTVDFGFYDVKGPVLLHSAHYRELNEGFLEMKFTGPGFEGKAKYEPELEKLREVVLVPEPSTYKAMFSYAKKTGGKQLWESKFFSSKGKLKSSGFYEKVWMLTVLFEKPYVRIVELHKDSGVQRKD